MRPLGAKLRLPMHLLLGLLVCSVLLSQTMGLLHGIVHMHPNEAQARAHAHTPDAESEDLHGLGHAHHHGHANLLDHLFSGHASDNDCRLYDQCSHMDALPAMAALAQALVFLLLFVAISKGLAVARWHALFQARGPPLIR